jgi:signal transduction histidine kinase
MPLNLPATTACITATLCLFMAAVSLLLSRAHGWTTERWIAAISLSSAIYIAMDIPATLDIDLAWVEVLNSVQTLFAGAMTASWVVHSQLVLRGPPVGRLMRSTAVALLGLAALISVPAVGSAHRRISFFIPVVDSTYHLLEPTPLGKLVITLFPLTFIWMAVRFGLAWRRKVPMARTYFFALAVLVAAGVNDALVWAGVIRMPLIVDVCYVVPTVIAVLSLTRKVIRESAELAELSTLLERKVEERTLEERQRAKELGQALEELGLAHRQLETSHHTLKEAQAQLLETSRRAGMAEVAICVLHNIGNALNSVNVAAETIREALRDGRLENLSSLAKMLEEHQDDLGRFLTEDPRGQRVPDFISTLAKHSESRTAEVREEVTCLIEHVGHIKNIIMSQQDNARVVGVDERFDLGAVVTAALEITGLTGGREGISVSVEVDEVPSLSTDRHKVIQVLVNLLSNAKHALRADVKPRKELRVRGESDGDKVRVTVADSGIGIARESLTRIFAFGFTTKHDGHGFGLHSSANVAREIGGSLACRSDGVGHGATFTFEFPPRRVAAADSSAHPARS